MKKTILLILVATMSINITIAQDSTAFQGVSGNPIEEFVEEESEPDILEDEQNSKEEIILPITNSNLGTRRYMKILIPHHLITIWTITTVRVHKKVSQYLHLQKTKG